MSRALINLRVLQKYHRKGENGKENTSEGASLFMIILVLASNQIDLGVSLSPNEQCNSSRCTSYHLICIKYSYALDSGMSQLQRAFILFARSLIYSPVYASTEDPF